MKKRTGKRKIGAYVKYLTLCLAIMLFIACIPSGVYADEQQDMPSDDEVIQAQTQELEQINLDEVVGFYANRRLEHVDNVVIFVRFSDSAEYINQTKIGYANMTFNEDKGSLKKYVGRISYGDISVNTSFYPCENGNYYSVQLSHPMDYYKKQYTKTDGTLSEGYVSYNERVERERSLASEALNAVKSQLEASNLNFDDDGNGIADGVAFVVPTYGAMEADHIAHNDLLWPHKVSGLNTGVTLGGSLVSSYNLLGIGSPNVGLAGALYRSSTAVVHEFMHTLGLPDLYRYMDQSAYPMGPWDIMDGGSVEAVNICAYYQREYLGYGDPLECITSTRKGITLDTAAYQNKSEKYAVILKTSPNAKEYFVVENRRTEDSTFQKSEGLIVYRINETQDAGNGNSLANGTTVKDFIFAFRPGESSYNAGSGEIGYAAVSPQNAKGFTSLGKPLGMENGGYDNGILYYSDGSNSGIVIDNVRINGTQTTFDVSFSGHLSGDGSETSPYLIYSVADLKQINGAAGSTYYKLMNDLDMSGYKFAPIESFAGVFEGNNHIIKNLSVSDVTDASMFNVLEKGGEIRNLRFENIQIESNAQGTAAVVSQNLGTIDNVHVYSGSFNAPDGCAASIVYSSGGIVRNVTSSANVSGNRAAGLVNYIFAGSIDTGYVDGKITATGNACVQGAVFAYWQSGEGITAKNIFWDIEKTGQDTYGEFFGQNENINGISGMKINVPESCRKGQQIQATLIMTNEQNQISGKWNVSDASVLKIDQSQKNSVKITGVKAGEAAVSYEFVIAGRNLALQKMITVEDDNKDESETENKGESETENKDDEKPGQTYTSVQQFIIRLYKNVLNRDADASGLDAWTQVLVSGRESGAKVSEGFIYSKEFKERQLSDSDYLDVLYHTFLNRDADSAGKSEWMSQLANGVSRNSVFKGFVESDEFTGICSQYGIIRGNIQLTEPRDKNDNVTKFVVRCYRLCLGRDADESGLNGWCNAILTGQNTAKEAAAGFVFSDEFKKKNLSDTEYVKTLYRVFMDREADGAGLEAWVKVLKNGQTREHVFNGFADSNEFREICTRYGIK